MKRLQNCCFVVSLKTGGKIIGWLDIIIAVVASIVSLINFGLNTSRLSDPIVILKLLVGFSMYIATVAFFAWKLIRGVATLDSHKVCIFKWYTIITLINLLTSLISFNLFAFSFEDWDILKITKESVDILWLLYKIYVAYSIEVMLEEERLRTIIHQTQPFIDAPKNAEDVVPPTYNDVMSDNTAKFSND